MEIKPIAMKCTPEQWESIKHHFEGWDTTGVWGFGEDHYLTNTYYHPKNTIGNIPPSIKSDQARTVFEQWDADIFLEYCGIKQSTTSSVKSNKVGPVLASNAKRGDKVVRGSNFWSKDNTQNIDDTVYGIITEVCSVTVIVDWYKKADNTIFEELATNRFYANEYDHELSYYQEENQKINTYEQINQNSGTGSAIEVRRPVGTVATRNRPTGEVVQGPGIRTAIEIGHLSHKPCIG